MQTEVKISDVLHLAADKYLAKDHNEFSSWGQKQRFSCCAVEQALEVLQTNDEMYKRVSTGLAVMGCRRNSFDSFAQLEESTKQFGKCTPESQAARYFWLKWAALQAEIQGE